MADASIEKVLDVEFEKLFKIITDYASYPEFVEGCEGVKVLGKKGDATHVQYSVNMMKEFTYTLAHKEDAKKGVIEWALVDSDFFKKNSGRWELKPAGKGKTEARYSLEVEFTVPVPGFILKRLVKGNLPGMLDAFESRAKKSKA
jgi:ribosome-associated toxin RatA of RatAB toxin-antitoxin module